MRARAAVVGVIVVTVAACSVRGGSPRPDDSQPLGSAAAPAATDVPATQALTPPPPSAASPTDGPPAASPPDEPADTPVASLIVDGQRYPGEIGGYTFGRITSSAPWLPAFALDQVTVPAGSRLTVELDDKATIAGWTARYAAAGDTAAFVVTGLGSDNSSTAVFRPPPPGDWVLSVEVTYGGGVGNGAYFWHLVVE
ncbi:MAG TPA: PPC domain-containing protein [Candidatus Limnocylindrales bacterium]|nr:PPC domain-containing protein [Candidatus Limnocylindrales bacterium]